MFEKPTIKIEKTPEKIVELGGNTLNQEALLDMEPKRSGGYLLSTLLAIGLALGVMGGRAEAQVVGKNFPQGPGFGGRVAGEVLNRGTYEASGAIDRAQNEKRSKIEHEYVNKLTELGNVERQLENDYANKTVAEDEYKLKKTELVRIKTELKKDHDRQIRNINIKSKIIGGIFQGVRGW